jgi:hypothetical protein
MMKTSVKDYAFNGRQIRNVVSTALGMPLMGEDKKKLWRKHLECVSLQTEEFHSELKAEEYVFKKLHG